MGHVRAIKGVLIAGGLLFVAAFGVLLRVPEQPARPTRATIVHVTYLVSYGSIQAIAQYKGDDGRKGADTFLPSEFTCHVGDRVDAEEVGVTLRLRPPACRHNPPSPWAR